MLKFVNDKLWPKLLSLGADPIASQVSSAAQFGGQGGDMFALKSSHG